MIRYKEMKTYFVKGMVRPLKKLIHQKNIMHIHTCSAAFHLILFDSISLYFT